MRRRQAGQSIVEAIVVVVIVVILVTGLVAGTTTSLKSSRSGKIKSQAIQYAQEGIELARALRDQGWTAFRAKTGDWCLTKEGEWRSAGPDCPRDIDETFARRVIFRWDDPRMIVTVRVSWIDETGDRSVESTTYFTQWK